PQAVRPSTSAARSSGEECRPSRPTLTRRPPASRTTVPKLRPTARASAAARVSPTRPRMSYSRRTVESNAWRMLASRAVLASAPDAGIGDAGLGHLVGVVEIAQVDDDRCL